MSVFSPSLRVQEVAVSVTGATVQSAEAEGMECFEAEGYLQGEKGESSVFSL